MRDFISVVVPVYNEEKAIVSTIERIEKVMHKSNCKYEIIVVDDCSTDKRGVLLDKIKGKIRGISVIRHVVNKGYGASLKTGIKSAKGIWILITDADGTYPIEDAPKLLEHMDKYDMVVGARTGKNVSIPFARRPAKWFLTKVASYIASEKIPDLNSGFRIFKKDLALEFWKMFPEGFSFTSTLTVACLTNGYNVKHVPIDYFKRKGKSTVHPFNDFIGFNRLLLKLMLFFKPLKVFVPLSIFLFLAGVSIFLVGLLVFNKFLDATFVTITLSAIQIFVLGLVAELIIRKR